MARLWVKCSQIGLSTGVVKDKRRGGAQGTQISGSSKEGQRHQRVHTTTPYADDKNI